VDRKKDIIVSGGENISSLEVEKTLLSHPAVLEVAVVPVPDERWGEVPKALVVLKLNMQAGEVELIEHCRLRLAHYKCPSSIEYLESLPRTGTGKVLKRDLRKKYWQGRETIRPDFEAPEARDCKETARESSGASVARPATQNK
jgi:fatty-acyl-CoA synthase